MTAPEIRRRRLLVIFNPVPGRRARRKFAAVLTALRAIGVEATVRETGAPGDAERLARGATSAEFDAVAAAGGDGTINEVANGLGDPRLPLMVFPFGTANVLAHEIGLPRDPAALARLAASGAVRELPLGEALFEHGSSPRRKFVLMAGAGFDAEVVENLDLHLKRRFGKLAFAWSILQKLCCYRPSEFTVAVEGAGAPGEVRATTVIATRAHFYGGRFMLAPAADLRRPEFQVVRFRRAGRCAALAYMLALARGVLHRRPDIAIAAATGARITGPANAPVQIDGDVLGRLPMRLAIAAEPLRLIWPDA